MISSIGGSTSYWAMQRPDMSQMASKLFSQLDTKNQGYIEQSDLETAFSSLSSSDSSASVEEIFNQLDADGNGKVTEQEMSASMKELTEQFESSFNASRTSGMPPPPPPSDEEDEGLTEDQLTSIASEVSSSDSKLSSLLSVAASNFDAADADGDGKVTFSEAMAYQESQQSTSSSAAANTNTVTAASDSSSSTSTSTSQAEILHRIMQLMDAYRGFGTEDTYANPLAGSLSVSV